MATIDGDIAFKLNEMVDHRHGLSVYSSTSPSCEGASKLAWPKIIDIGGMRVPIDSWEELRDAYIAVTAYGIPLTVPTEDATTQPAREVNGPNGLSHGDKTLLTQFVEAGERGLLTAQLAQALGRKGKGVRPALERWSRRIGLVSEENTSAFEPMKRYDGRGFKMIEHFRRTAASMLGRPL